MARINIAFDSRQVAGWEQMLGGRTCGVTFEKEMRNDYMVQHYKLILINETTT